MERPTFWARLRARANRVVRLRAADVLTASTDLITSEDVIVYAKALADDGFRFERMEFERSADPRLPDLPSYPEDVGQSILRPGDVGYVVHVDDEPAGWVWRLTRSFKDRDSGLHVHVGSDEAYLYDAYIEPRFRARHAAAALFMFAVPDMRDDGITKFFTFIEKKNADRQDSKREMIGLEKCQEFVQVTVACRYGFVIPWTLRPRTGPCSLRRRHNGTRRESRL